MVVIIPTNYCTFICWGHPSCSLCFLNGVEFSFIYFFFSIPLLPVIYDAIQHGLDLWMEARELLNIVDQR